MFSLHFIPLQWLADAARHFPLPSDVRSYSTCIERRGNPTRRKHTLDAYLAADRRRAQGADRKPQVTSRPNCAPPADCPACIAAWHNTRRECPACGGIVRQATCAECGYRVCAYPDCPHCSANIPHAAT